MDQYTKKEIAAILVEPPRKIQFWVDSGLVVPGLSPPSRRGKAMLFSQKNLIEFGMIKVLQNCNLTIKTILPILKILRQQDDKYKTFFSDLSWGTEKELIYQYTQPDNLPLSLWIYDESLKNPFVFIFCEDINDRVSFTKNNLFLGRIKVQAMKNLGLIDKNIPFKHNNFNG